MTYDQWKTRSPDDELYRGLPYRDDPPQQWFVCDACDGSGEEVFGFWGYEAGCSHGHMMDDARPCGKCNGDGGWIDDVEPSEAAS